MWEKIPAPRQSRGGDFIVDRAGIEPAASSMPSRHSATELTALIFLINISIFYQPFNFWSSNLCLSLVITFLKVFFTALSKSRPLEFAKQIRVKIMSPISSSKSWLASVAFFFLSPQKMIHKTSKFPCFFHEPSQNWKRRPVRPSVFFKKFI